MSLADIPADLIKIALRDASACGRGFEIVVPISPPCAELGNNRVPCERASVVVTMLQMRVIEDVENESEVESPESRWSAVAALVEQAQAGDRDAMGALVEQFQKTVYSICFTRLGNANEALELTQEVFLHVVRRINQLREPERFAGWLRQVAVRMAINRATRRPPMNSTESEILEGLGQETHNPLQELISRERAERLWEGMNQLKPLDRDVLLAFYIEGQSLLEIADNFSVPLGTVKRRLHVARNRLKDLLQAGVSDRSEWSDDHEDDDCNSVNNAGIVVACAV